jgi:flagellar hook-length control protein FliK
VVPGDDGDEPEAPARSPIVTKSRDAGEPTGARSGVSTTSGGERHAEIPIEPRERSVSTPAARTLTADSAAGKIPVHETGESEARSESDAKDQSERRPLARLPRFDAAPAEPKARGENAAPPSNVDALESLTTKLDHVSRARSEPGVLAPRSSGQVTVRVMPGLEAQLAVKAREFLARGETRIRVTLDPPSLGRLNVRLEVSDSHAVARIVASSPEAAALLTREREDLVRAFQDQGFDEVHVSIGSEEESTARGRNGDDRREGEAEDVPAPAKPRGVGATRSRAAAGASPGVDVFV